MPVTVSVATLAILCALPAPESSVAVYSNVTVAVSPSASASKFPTTSYVPAVASVMVTASPTTTAALLSTTETDIGSIWKVCVSVVSKSVVKLRVPVWIVSIPSVSRITVCVTPNVLPSLAYRCV